LDILLEESIDLGQVADLMDKSAEPRDHSAWHVTNLLESARLITKGDTRYHEYEGEPLGIMHMGRIWEAVVDGWLADFAARKGGVYTPNVVATQDNIIASLDGIMLLPTYGTVVVESKLRFTLNEEIPFRHQQQTRAYCHLYNTDTVLFSVLGLVSGPPTAKAKLRIVRYTRQSIIENWEMLINTKRYLESQGLGPTK
jgi:hypothetical protein